MSMLFFDFEIGEGLKHAKYLGRFYLCSVCQREREREREGEP